MKTSLVLFALHSSLLLLSFGYASTNPLPIAIGFLAATALTLSLLTQEQRAHRKLLQSLEHGLQSLRDNDFSVNLNDQQVLADHQLISTFNQTSEELRLERQRIYQREMLLDKVLNASPMAMILVDQRGKIVFTNDQATQTFKLSHSLLGHDWPTLVNSLAPEFQNALHSQGESIVTLTDAGQQQAWHVSSSLLRVHQAQHQLFLLKTITQELSKQEVATWKKVISVISHELNNSIAPISSMCHSGELLANKLDEPRLNRVFNTISGRVSHLNDFIKGYATLTKIKQPQKAPIHWRELIAQLQPLYPFKVHSPIPADGLLADVAQLEQVLINILKNAHEAAQNCDVGLVIEQRGNHIAIEISDSGPGMSQEVIQNALLPFYSTKHSGTGVGLALSREIIEAHQGKLIFSNRDQGGLCVTVMLPC